MVCGFLLSIYSLVFKFTILTSISLFSWGFFYSLDSAFSFFNLYFSLCLCLPPQPHHHLSLSLSLIGPHVSVAPDWGKRWED